MTAIVGGEQRRGGRTTPEAIDLQRTFAEMLAAGDDAVVMEVSSHALALHRADAIHWSAAVFTNLTQDHLDFHADMEDYFVAKRRLFEAGPELAVVNVDDPYGARLARDFPHAIRIGLDAPDAQVRATAIEGDASGSAFAVDGLALRTTLPGRFNVLNALGAVVVARELGVDDAAIASGLAAAERVPGPLRARRRGPALRGASSTTRTRPTRWRTSCARPRELTARAPDRRLRRGRRPRPRQAPADGRVAAAELADVAIVTSDNPRSEDPEAIIAEIAQGMSAHPPAERVVDRQAAIERAIALAAPGDVVVIAGKGHEQRPGVRGRPQGALRRRRRRPRGAAGARVVA